MNFHGGQSSLPELPLRSGYYYPVGGAIASTNAALNNGVLRVGPFYVPTPTSFSLIGISVATGADADFRLGVYRDNGGIPGALLLDAGVVSAAASGAKEVAISLALPAGLVWVGGTVQNQVAAPTMRTSTSPVVGIGTPDNAVGSSSPKGFQVTGVTGALPDPFGTPAASSDVPRVYLRVA
jgi:hypothetical protein